MKDTGHKQKKTKKEVFFDEATQESRPSHLKVHIYKKKNGQTRHQRFYTIIAFCQILFLYRQHCTD